MRQFANGRDGSPNRPSVLSQTGAFGESAAGKQHQREKACAWKLMKGVGSKLCAPHP
jgi:hypothetical protein